MLGSRDVGVPGVIVRDVEAALGQLARELLRRLPETTVVALTGSSGKTSTKDLLGQVLATHAPTVFTEGSFNNEIGLPLTVLRADENTRYLLLEMGARGVGHIKQLCELAPPNIGLVLNIGTAHVGEFGSKETTAAAKGELIEALPKDGLAVLNADDDYVARMAERSDAPVLWFGDQPSARVRATDVTVDENSCASFTLSADGVEARAQLRFVGEHQVSNALAAAAVCIGVGMSVPEIAAGIDAAEPLSGGRMTVTHRADGVIVIDDAYNANPESMRAGLKALVTLARSRPEGRVLGGARADGRARRHLGRGARRARSAGRTAARGPAAGGGPRGPDDPRRRAA